MVKNNQLGTNYPILYIGPFQVTHEFILRVVGLRKPGASERDFNPVLHVDLRSWPQFGQMITWMGGCPGTTNAGGMGSTLTVTFYQVGRVWLGLTQAVSYYMTGHTQKWLQSKGAQPKFNKSLKLAPAGPWQFITYMSLLPRQAALLRKQVRLQNY